MPSSFILKTFGCWLRQNRRRFRFQPVIVKRLKNCIQLRFKGISQKIQCVITQHCADIYVSHQGECWDILIDFGVAERKSSAGYYCELCEPDTRGFFSTREELWIEHCFEPLLEWVNGSFDNSHWVYLLATKGATWAEIKGKDDVKVDSKYLVHAFPVVERMREEVSYGSVDR